MQHVKAMQYYRFWIYACNCVLLASVLFFVGVGSYVFGDSRMSLVTGVRYYHPTFLYAYVAIVLQGGVVQVIGCLGALRLNERLLCIYWLLLLGLLVGDVLVGVIWVFSFQKVVSSLPDELNARLNTEYGVDSHFTGVWDLVQNTERCCGLRSPQDFSTSVWAARFAAHPSADGVLQLPSSCCRGNTVRHKTSKTYAISNIELAHHGNLTLAQPVVKLFRKRKWGRPGIYIQRPPPPLRLPTTTEPPPFNGTCIDNDRPNTVFGRGCLKQLLHWYKARADILFILGYCVITFLKLCFIGLLRFEIREMIQKMRLLRAEMAAVDVEAATSTSTRIHSTTNHVHTGAKAGGAGGTGGGLLAKIVKTKKSSRWRIIRERNTDAGCRKELLDRSTGGSATTAAVFVDRKPTTFASRRQSRQRQISLEAHELTELPICQQTEI